MCSKNPDNDPPGKPSVPFVLQNGIGIKNPDRTGMSSHTSSIQISIVKSIRNDFSWSSLSTVYLDMIIDILH